VSYCRWSCDHWRSDVYCYAHVDETWTTHVAGRRRVGLENVPPPPSFALLDTPEVWKATYAAHQAALGRCEFEPIALPHAGETFKDDNPQEMIETLLRLRGLGYHVPEHALAALREEVAEEAV
jgi:hypothetical protein